MVKGTSRLLRLLQVAGSFVIGTSAFSNKCGSLTSNLLTSRGCPSSCGSFPCVLFSPLLETTKPCLDADAAGPCFEETNFTLSGTATTCNITYQCLNSVVDPFNKQWLLALQPVVDSDTYTTAYVTKIQNLVYQRSNLISTLQLSGGPTDMPKGEMVDISMDDSIFDTPSTCTAAFFSHMNMRSILVNATLPSFWTKLELVNLNLIDVPFALSNMNLTSLSLAKNYIATFSTDPTGISLDKVTSLNLAENDLTSFEAVLPAIKTLNLTGNPLRTVPDAIFSMSTLKNLYMNDCQLTNLVLSADQYDFLDWLTTFEADIVFTGPCPPNYTQKMNRNQDIVCVPDTAATTMTQSDSRRQNDTVKITLVVACGTLMMCIIAFLVYRSIKRRQTDGKHFISMIDDDERNGDVTICDPWSDHDLLAIRVQHSDVQLVKRLAHGSFGEVFLGVYMHQNVAVKRLRRDKRTLVAALAFASEIKTMARLDHPKIVRFIGVSWTSLLSIQAVTELMNTGDLKSFLSSKKAKKLTWANSKCQIAFEIADALVYLHSLQPKMVHRDLKSRNVLIDSKAGAKLSDFGLSRYRPVEATMTACVGTSRWMAPEVILGSHYTEYADIYSFGVVLSELDTCKTPFYDVTSSNGGRMSDLTILQRVSTHELVPTFEDSCPDSILKLARACLSFDPVQRPTATYVSLTLRNIMSKDL